jgi:general secretion pathway protein G
LLEETGMRRSSPGSRNRRRGFTIVELLAVCVIIGALVGFAIPKFKSVYLKAQNARAIGDIRAIEIDLMAIEAAGQPLPASLAAIGRDRVLDPWGRPYVYFPFDTTAMGNPPGARRDRFLVPINSTFDLYSMGPDGSSVLALTSTASKDDIIRANDGGYIGLASKF